MRRFVYLAVLALAFLFSCEFKNEEELFGSGCDTINVTYKTVEPIFGSNCIYCHNDQVNNHNIRLNSFINAKAAAETGLLKKAVNHEPGVTPMPYQLNKLDSCSVRKITIWITNKTPQ